MSEYIETHTHKYFAFQTKAEFEPIFTNGEVLYRRVEYLISGCNCGKSLKSATKDIDNA